MSGQGRTWGLDEAWEAADLLLEALVGSFRRAQVAGSIRRLRSQVHDIDVVVEPRFEGRRANLLGDQIEVSLLDERLMALMDAGRMTITKNGPKMKSGTWLPSGIPFDIYVATEETWATTLLIRTGSALHNVMLCTLAREMGMMLAANGDGLFKAAPCAACEGRGCDRCRGDGHVHGALVASESEEGIFRALGLGWIPAPHREIRQAEQETGAERRQRGRAPQPGEDMEVY